MRQLVIASVLIALACQPTTPTTSPSPSPTPLVFWLVDSPATRGPTAFGSLPPERQAKRVLTIGSYELAASLPTAPPTLNVYVAGGYPESDTARVSVFGEPGWEFVPFYSLLQYVGAQRPLGPAAPVASDADALARAEWVLRPRGLLPADTEATRVAGQGAGWRITFARRIDGRVDFANKGNIVTLDANGQIRNVLARRRPLLEQSAYPTRSAAEAWTLVQAGRWLTFIVEDGAPTTPATVDRFVVRSVAIVYVEGEVLSARDIIRPFYVFRDGNDQTIYVSAIANDFP